MGIFILGCCDLSKKDMTVEDYVQSFSMMLDGALMDEAFQVNGVILLIDFTGVGMEHYTFVGPETVKVLAEIVLVSI